MDEFIRASKERHGKKYDYSHVNYNNNLTPVTITCLRCRDSFSQLPKVHKRGSGCPTCSKKNAGLARRSGTLNFKKKSY